MSSSAPDAPVPLDAARERVVRLLTDRYADDSLTVEQFEAELDRLHALNDVAALDRMADALTSGVRPAVSQGAVSQGAVSHGAVAPLADAGSAVGWQYGALIPRRMVDEGRMFAVMSSSKRGGGWLVPRRFHAFAMMSEAVIDLRDAVLPADGCEIEIGAIMANVKVLLPAAVETEVAVMAFMGNVHDRTLPDLTATPAPRVRVTGSAVMSELQVLQGAEADIAALAMDD